MMRIACLPTVRVLESATSVTTGGGGYLRSHILGVSIHPFSLNIPTTLPLWDTHPQTYSAPSGIPIPLDILTAVPLPLGYPPGRVLGPGIPQSCGQTDNCENITYLPATIVELVEQNYSPV